MIEDIQAHVQKLIQGTAGPSLTTETHNALVSLSEAFLSHLTLC